MPYSSGLSGQCATACARARRISIAGGRNDVLTADQPAGAPVVYPVIFRNDPRTGIVVASRKNSIDGNARGAAMSQSMYFERWTAHPFGAISNAAASGTTRRPITALMSLGSGCRGLMHLSQSNKSILATLLPRRKKTKSPVAFRPPSFNCQLASSYPVHTTNTAIAAQIPRTLAVAIR